MKPAVVLSGLLCLITVLLSAQAQAAPPTVGSCPVFPPDHVWNTPIDTMPVDPNSTAYVNTIGATRGLKADFGSGLWEGGPIGIPYITVPGTQQKYNATFYYDEDSDHGQYAIPLDAPIEGGSQSTGDRHVISIDRDNCILYELFDATPGTNSWSAGSGVIWDMRSYEMRTPGYTSADAAGLAIYPGLVKIEEVLAGEINHAIRFTVPQTRGTYIWPASHEASSLTGSQYPPMGQRFRLKASFDISGFSAQNQVILRALKKYGMILADNGSSWYMSGVPDERWNNTDLNRLRNVPGSAFEAIDESSLMISPNSYQARQSTGGATATPTNTPTRTPTPAATPTRTPTPVPSTATPTNTPTTSVSVSPASASVVAKATRQFSATVTGNSNTAVTWLVNGVQGGNSTVGTVSSSGLYTAPNVPPSPATVTVQARSNAVTSAMGSASVTVVALPAITTVSPNPVTVGNFTLTVNGSGFQSGAVVKWGSANLSTTRNSASQLTATGSASSTSSGIAVTVANPDGGVSNVVNVPVVAAPAGVAVSVSPATASVAGFKKQQFTATVTGTSNTAVTWKVNGITGGNGTVGTITTAGVYTAPWWVPNPATVTITATSNAAPTVSGSATVTVKWWWQ